ncbi:cysteine hydrolase family protein [Microbulbifer halophilus]|uniref:Cysteine hydrolase family protein n=1 Tax=Microbulbifer halophilus TaxID=453963 RepID=A0ABW5EJR4_9GAMM|nr:cysteine hydrolase family protein [Microbulbifer halophilus]MCW8128660.1 cysteine hydrolase family protein [Microbulbifer halophilus]
MTETENPALLVIDVQRAIDHFSRHGRNNPDAEQRIAGLLAHWRDRQWPIVHIRHSSRFPESPYHADGPHFAFKAEVAPAAGETVVTKRENCAFIDTDLDSTLRRLGITELVATGVVTNHSVAATVKAGAALGYRILLPEDTTAAFGMTLRNGESIEAEQLQQVFLSNLDGEYARVCHSRDLVSSQDG